VDLIIVRCKTHLPACASQKLVHFVVEAQSCSARRLHSLCEVPCLQCSGLQGNVVGNSRKKHCLQVPEPFQLPGDALHQHAEAAKQQYLEEEEQKRKAQAAFKV